MKKIIWIVLILALGAAIYFYFKKKEANPLSLTTEQLSTGPISNSVTATGTLQPVDTVAVGAQVSGTIQKIYVDFNSVVKKGQLLATLDKSLITDQINQNKANLQSTQSNYLYQQQNFDRQTKLYNAGAISKAEMETAQSQYNAALSGVAGAKAVLAQSQRNLSYTNILSPINGTVLSRNVSEGQTVASSFNTPTLFSIARDLTKMQVRATVDEADIGNVKKGQKADFSVDAFPDDLFSGSVEEVRLQPVVTSNVVNYITIIDAGNTNLKLKPGMTANVTIFLQKDSAAQLISAKDLSFVPDPALAKQYTFVPLDQNGTPKVGKEKSADSGAQPASVWVLAGNQLIQKKILTGMNDNIHVQVISGLSAAATIVTGIQTGLAKEQVNADEKSPFMPSRRRTTTPKKSN